MKVLHINTRQGGGAALCAMRINRAMIQEGLESRMLFAEGTSVSSDINDDIAEQDISFWNRNWILKKIRNQIAKLPWYMDFEKLQQQLDFANTNNLYLHQPLSRYKDLAYHPLVKWADIIHLHWVAGFIDYPSFFKIVDKPIVWTLHDKYPAVGIQHYSTNFHPVPIELQDIDKECKRIKRQSVLKSKNLHLVAISKQMQYLCEKSDVLEGIHCTLIHNGVDTNIFRRIFLNREIFISKYYNQINTKFFKKTIISKDTKIFLFSSFYVWDKNKGLEMVINALNSIDYRDKILIVVGGCDITPEYTTNFPLIFTGLIDNQDELAKIYSCADFFIQASYEESFGQTLLESLSCGCPVISTPVGIAPEIINENNGILCSDFDMSTMVDGINKAIQTEYNKETIRLQIIECYNFTFIAQEYIDLYNQIMKS